MSTDQLIRMLLGENVGIIIAVAGFVTIVAIEGRRKKR